MKEKKKGKIIKTVIFIFFALLFLVLIYVNGLFPNPFLNPPDEPFSVKGWQTGELKLHFMDVGQGDCTVIELPDGKKMMIDGGNGTRENNQKILGYLEALGIEKLDYVLVTHADKDHFGGVESVLNEVEVHHVYLPYQATLASEDAYLSLYQTALKKAFTVEYSERYMHIQGENYFFMFLSPKSPSFTQDMEDNETSAVVWLDYLGTNALFTGDMTNRTEALLLQEYTLLDGIFDLKDMHVNLESTEILKVAHHGSAYSSSLQWLELLNAETAIISCGAGNSYGHPSSQALENLRIANPDIQIYRTDECGTIVLTATRESTYATVYENQSAASAAVLRLDGLLGLAEIKTKSSFTENFLP